MQILIAPDKFPALTDWPLIAHALLVGLAILTSLRDAIAVGRSALMDALHIAYIRRTSRTGRAGDDR